MFTTLFAATPLFVYQPRGSLAYQLRAHTAIHAGFGVFNDIIPQQIADNGLMNAPNDPSFTGGLAGQVGGIGIAPNVPGSAVDATASANQVVSTIFSSGGPPCAGIQQGAPTCPLAVSMNTFPTGTLKTPDYYQFNLGVEQQLGFTRQPARRLCGHSWTCTKPTRSSSTAIRTSATDALRHSHTSSRSINALEM
jgi:hypothetical protein